MSPRDKFIALLGKKYFFSLKEVKNVITRNCCSNLKNSFTKKSKYLRNIGIMAHIDAGKTTTTERILYYSGVTKFVGEVHDGNTVTDYMDQERERGITITSASVSFPWSNHLVNLIDTPGHVDFTIEVERSLRILDGAVAVFDASAGVEAQSLTVWLQADRYNLPRICYLNKMDKENASLTFCIEDIKKKLNTRVLVTQFPLGKGKSFDGVIDLVYMKKMQWCRDSFKLGRNFESTPLTAELDKELWMECSERRSNLVEELADLDNEVAEIVLEKESTHLVSPNLVHEALKRITHKRLGVVLLMGSSYKNVGVQPLMDAIIDYLPSPIDSHHPKVDLYAPNLCAVAFKIIHHKRMGPMTFIRIYSGHLEQGQNIYNANKNSSEKIFKLFIASADEFNEIKFAGTGSILVATGLKVTATGDTLVQSESIVIAAQNKLKEQNSLESQVLMGVKIPDPVFMCSIEAPSLSQQTALDKALSCLQKEDPSLTVQVEESGQIVLAGMGELHLSVIKDRICKEYKIEAELGPLQISYRESIKDYAIHTTDINKIIGGSKQAVKITLSLEPQVGYEINKIELAHSKDNLENLQTIRRTHLEAVKRGIKAALMSGPILHFPVINVCPKLHWLEVGRKTAESMIAAAASQCVREILKNDECYLLEPMMRIEIVVPEERSSVMLDELSKRRADINNVEHRQSMKILSCICPLSELVGFASTARAISSGLANLSMEFAYHRKMTNEEQSNAVLAMSGYLYSKK